MKDRFPSPLVERTYENALRIINSRQRQKRPDKAGTNKMHTSDGPGPSGTPGLRGTPSLFGMAAWLELIGYSEEDLKRLKIIHIAGTKGKGSTCAFTESMLRAHGRRTDFPRKTGLYTSPHLMLPEERIRINSQPLSRTLFAQYFFEIYDSLPQLSAEYDPSKDVVERGPRYLQLFALLAFHTFIREKVDVTILETHSGGEYDATNIVQQPVVTAVSTLGMDHVDMLGPTIENIAWHKSGIFKHGAIALSAPQDSAPAAVLESRSRDKGGAVRFVKINDELPGDSAILKPDVQKINASLAIATSQAWLSQCAPDGTSTLTRNDVIAGIEQFSWPGRFQTIRDGKWIWSLDSAHNDMSVEVAAKWFAESSNSSTPRILIFSHINELRDAAKLLESLGRYLKLNGVHMDHVIFSTYDELDVEDGREGKDVPVLFRTSWEAVDTGSKLWHEPTIQGAVRKARLLGSDGMQTLITGSQHLVGPALRVLGWTPTLP